MNGKAGSGTSTLTRYLDDNPRTKDYLQGWAESRVLVTAGFFFWNLGTDIQKSLTGLLRSFLVELLQQIAALAKAVNLWRWQSYELGASRLLDWTGRELEDEFGDPCQRAQDSMKICPFIDDLDEFERNYTAHAELIELFEDFPIFHTLRYVSQVAPSSFFKMASEIDFLSAFKI